MSTMDKVAEWLCDEFGEEGDEPKDWMSDTRDLLSYLKAHQIILVNLNNLSKTAKRQVQREQNYNVNQTSKAART